MKKLQGSQVFRYIMTGGMTTVINYLLYLTLTAFSVNYLVANSVAWAGAVIFAFYANRQVVFRSTGNKRDEFLQFLAVRILTLFVENMLLYFLVDYMEVSSIVSKVAVSVITVALNYVACKHRIFKEGGVSHE